MTRVGSALAVAGALLAVAPLPAQVVDGLLLDGRTRQPVARASVVLVDSAGAAVAREATGANGRFRLRAPAGGVFGLRAEGADGARLVDGKVQIPARQTTYVEVLTGTGLVAAASGANGAAAVELEPLEAVAAVQRRYLTNAGFYDRQRSGSGLFLTGDEFRARPGARAVDALQGLRGTYARPSASKISVGGSTMSWVLYQNRFGRRCTATLWVDGIERDPEVLHDIDAEDVEAVEVYSGSENPLRFWNPRRDSGATRCGAVVLWLKRAQG
jgi:hypothetical protein